MVEQVDVKCSRCNESCYGEVISKYGKYYHQYCFSCIVGGCNHDLSQVGFFLVDGELYCREDYRKLRGVKCAGCSKYVEGDAVSVAESCFHPSCFGCVRCGKVFRVGDDVCYDGEDFFCQTCTPRKQTEAPKDSEKADTDTSRNEHIDSKLSSGKCAGCDTHISTGQALLALDKQWHLWCFTCFKCSALLTGEYMGREGLPYCEKDYQAEFGINCAGCGDYITGKVLQAGEKHYHPSCSRCAKCGGMFGEGEDMYLQGNEIWHPDCSDGHVPSDSEQSNGSKPEDYETEAVSPITTPRTDKDAEQGFFTTAAPASEVEPINENNAALSNNLNPIPYGKPPGFRSVKPPGFRSVKPPVPVSHPPSSQTQTPSKLSDDETEDAPPPVPPPPTRSTSSQWRQKYISVPRSNAEKSGQSSTPVSCAESSNPPSADENNSELKNTFSDSTDSLNSNSNGTLTKKGIGFNRLQHRMNTQKDVRSVKLPTHIDPDRLRQFLNDPEHNVYLEDHEFYDVFKITREKFYTLPQHKKQELKSGILFS